MGISITFFGFYASLTIESTGLHFDIAKEPV